MEQIDRFELRGLLGQGGMGRVYRAWDPSLRREVALKVFLDARDLERFEREAQVAASLRHPALVTVHEQGRDRAGRPYLVMELLRGETLRQRVERDGPLPALEALDLGRALALGLAHAHERRVVHRDVKPDNVLLTGRGPVLTDFGLAAFEDPRQRLTQTGEILGTPAFMSPEQAAGDVKAMGPATDVYGLCATLYFALCGQPPFQGRGFGVLRAVIEDPPPALDTLRPGLPGSLVEIVTRGLAKRSADRPADGAALVGLLGGAELGEDGSGQPAAGRALGVLLLGLLALLVPLAVGTVLLVAPGSGPGGAPGPRLTPATSAEAPPAPSPSVSSLPARPAPTGARIVRLTIGDEAAPGGQARVFFLADGLVAANEQVARLWAGSGPRLREVRRWRPLPQALDVAPDRRQFAAGVYPEGPDDPRGGWLVLYDAEGRRLQRWPWQGAPAPTLVSLGRERIAWLRAHVVWVAGRGQRPDPPRRIGSVELKNAAALLLRPSEVVWSSSGGALEHRLWRSDLRAGSEPRPSEVLGGPRRLLRLGRRFAAGDGLGVVAIHGPDGLVGAWRDATAAVQPELRGVNAHLAGVSGLCFVPGRGVATLGSGEREHTLKLWDPLSGALLAAAELEEPGGLEWSWLDASPDGRWLALVDRLGQVVLYPTEVLLGPAPAPGPLARQRISMPPERRSVFGGFLESGAGAGKVVLASETQAFVYSLPGAAGRPAPLLLGEQPTSGGATFVGRRSSLLLGGSEVRRYDAQLSLAQSWPETTATALLCESDDGQWLLAASSRRAELLHRDGARHPLPPTDLRVAAFLTDGGTLVLGYGRHDQPENRIERYDLSGGVPRRLGEVPLTGEPLVLLAGGDERVLVGTHSGVIHELSEQRQERRFVAADAGALYALAAHRGGVVGLARHPQLGLISLGGGERGGNDLAMWDEASGALRLRVPLPQFELPACLLDLSPDGELLLLGSEGGDFEVWRVAELVRPHLPQEW